MKTRKPRRRARAGNSEPHGLQARPIGAGPESQMLSRDMDMTRPVSPALAAGSGTGRGSWHSDSLPESDSESNHNYHSESTGSVARCSSLTQTRRLRVTV
jgi:hypothetical protein